MSNIIIILLLLFFSLFPQIVNATDEKLIYIFWLQLFFNMMLCFGVYYLLLKRCQSLNYLIVLSQAIFFCVLAQAIFVIFYYYFPAFKTIVWLVLEKEGNISVSSLVRSFGFSNGGGDGLGYHMMFGVIAGLYLHAILKKAKYFFFTVFILISLIFIARSAFLVGLLCLSSYIFFHIFIKRDIKFFLCNFFIFSILFLIFHNFLLNTQYYHFFQENTLRWTFDFFIHGTSRSGDAYSWIKMWRVSPDIKTLLFGDGRLSQGNKNYMQIDVGYLRWMFFWGITGSIFLYGVMVKVMIEIIQKIFWQSKKNIIYVSSVFFIMFLCNFKTLFIDSGLCFKLIMLMYLTTANSNKEYNIGSVKK